MADFVKIGVLNLPQQKVVKTAVFDGHSYFINLSMAQPGAYVLKVGNGSSQEVRRFVIQ